MGLKNSHTTADYLNWDVAMSLIRKLHRDGYYRESILLGTGCFTGLRISDILQLTFGEMLDKNILVIVEKKTGKRREIALNPDFQRHVELCMEKMGKNRGSRMFLSRKGGVISIQRVNIILKDIKRRYRVDIDNISSHSLRKTFARHIYDKAPDREYALVMLSQLLGHSDCSITRRYLGLKRTELLNCYQLLYF